MWYWFLNFKSYFYGHAGDAINKILIFVELFSNNVSNLWHGQTHKLTKPYSFVSENIKILMNF